MFLSDDGDDDRAPRQGSSQRGAKGKGKGKGKTGPAPISPEALECVKDMVIGLGSAIHDKIRYAKLHCCCMCCCIAAACAAVLLLHVLLYCRANHPMHIRYR